MGSFIDFLITMIISGGGPEKEDQKYFKYILFVVIFLIAINLFYYIFIT